jgi:transketolase
MTDEIKPMRLAVGQALVKYGKLNPDIVVLDVDTASSTQTIHFGQAFPDRFFNVGIAEANMMSIAAGLSLTGKIPFVSGFAFLMALRAGDQLRSQIAYGNLNVKIIGNYSGLSDYADGASHQSIADVSVIRSLPNMTVICCADLTEADMIIDAAIKHQGPVYIRVARSECGRLFDPASHPFEIGKGIELIEGDAITIITTGTMVEPAMEAARILKNKNIHPEVIEIHTLKPIDSELILKSAQKTGAVITCEEATVFGGLYSAVCEITAEHCPVKVAPIAIKDRFGETAESRLDLLKKLGLTCDDIVNLAEQLIAHEICR